MITNGSDETKSEDAEDCESDDREGGCDGRGVFEKPKSGRDLAMVRRRRIIEKGTREKSED